MMAKHRCPWCLGTELYKTYHDCEWGVPLKDDKRLFEFLILESFQAGLSWITILKKRAHFRKAFDGFDYRIIAGYDQKKVEQLLHDKGIVRHRLKIEAAIANARAFQNIQDEHGSFSNFIWAYVDGKPLVNSWSSLKQVPSKTVLSDSISKDLKKKGFRFVGSTTIYAFMQAIGMVNDHLTSCFRHSELTDH